AIHADDLFLFEKGARQIHPSPSLSLEGRGICVIIFSLSLEGRGICVIIFSLSLEGRGMFWRAAAQKKLELAQRSDPHHVIIRPAGTVEQHGLEPGAGGAVVVVGEAVSDVKRLGGANADGGER